MKRLVFRIAGVLVYGLSLFALGSVPFVMEYLGPAPVDRSLAVYLCLGGWVGLTLLACLIWDYGRQRQLH